ncbi:DUF1294 domain-containing protein [Primorskyibacter sp. S87]|uniref:DUF1294 domain-containing protein n=1 Tax=Primorskyibacter sp. S87 TaxID=3415126 RepID=UPI003C7C8275
MWFVVIYLWIINLLALLAIGLDKRRARARKRRIPERNLLWLAALGGSPGAILGRWMFRHKTRKRSYSVWMFLIAATQAGAFYLAIVRFPTGLK